MRLRAVHRLKRLLRVSCAQRWWQRLISWRIARLYARAIETQGSGWTLAWRFGIWPYLYRDRKAAGRLGQLSVLPSRKARVDPNRNGYVSIPVAVGDGYLEPGPMVGLYRDYLVRVVEGDPEALAFRRDWNSHREGVDDEVLISEARAALDRLKRSGLLAEDD